VGSYFVGHLLEEASPPAYLEGVSNEEVEDESWRLLI